MAVQVGDKLPEATFSAASADGPKPMTTHDVFAGKRVALFAVPGAFTPTCSARHLPGFKDKGAELKAKGIDAIACVSVNDAFVMQAWAKNQDVGEDILMLGDGSAAFSKAIGLDADFSKFGMGLRSQRYAMVVNDGVVEKLWVEQPGAFEVSSAEYMLEHI